MEFSEDDKYKIWIDYMVTQVALRNDFAILEEYNVWEDRCDNSFKKYPIFNVATKQLWLDFKVKPFDSFCAEEDYREPSGLKGWYWRFKDRIFK
jgi:hypothetical protein